MVYTNMVIDPNVRISNVNIDKDEQIISFNLTGIGVGSSYVNVYVFNNGTSATQIFTAEVKRTDNNRTRLKVGKNDLHLSQSC